MELHGDQSGTDMRESKPSGSDTDLKDLFAFLDRIETSDRAEEPKRAAQRPVEPAPRGSAGASPSRPLEPAPRPAAPSPPAPAKDDVPFLELVKEERPPAEPRRAAPPPEEKKERGGLLAFLRKKKQP
jgi:hypothetical protein